MAHWPPAINPFATILLSQICWDFLFVSYSPSFFSSKISPIDWLTSLHCAPSLREAQILLERWRHHYNTVRPLSAIGYRPPAPESILHWIRNRLCINIYHGPLNGGISKLPAISYKLKSRQRPNKKRNVTLAHRQRWDYGSGRVFQR